MARFVPVGTGVLDGPFYVGFTVKAIIVRHPERRRDESHLGGVEHGVRHGVSGSLLDRLSQTPHPPQAGLAAARSRSRSDNRTRVVIHYAHAASLHFPAGEGLTDRRGRRSLQCTQRLVGEPLTRQSGGTKAPPYVKKHIALLSCGGRLYSAKISQIREKLDTGGVFLRKSALFGGCFCFFDSGSRCFSTPNACRIKQKRRGIPRTILGVIWTGLTVIKRHGGG